MTKSRRVRRMETIANNAATLTVMTVDEEFTKDDWKLLKEQLDSLRAFWRQRLDERKDLK